MLNESVFANIPLHKSAGPDGDGRRAYLNASGAFIGRGTPLLEIRRDAVGRERFAARPVDDLNRILSQGYGVPVDLSDRADALAALAKAKNEGNAARAAVLLLYLRLPPLPSEEAAERLAKANGLLKTESAKAGNLRCYNPNWPEQLRQPKGAPGGGQWAVDAASAGEARGAERPRSAASEPDKKLIDAAERVAQAGPSDRAAQDEVARRAIADIFEKSEKEGRPYGGLIYQDPRDGTLHATPPVPGSSIPEKVDPLTAYGYVPQGFQVVATYRTSVNTVLSDRVSNEIITPYDARLSERTLYGVYVGTASGRLLYFDYATDTPTTYLGRIKP